MLLQRPRIRCEVRADQGNTMHRDHNKGMERNKFGMFFKSNKDSPIFPYFKSCTATFGTLLKASKKNKFITMLKNVYCNGNDKICGYFADYPYAINATCCDYMLINIANHYNILNKRRE